LKLPKLGLSDAYIEVYKLRTYKLLPGIKCSPGTQQMHPAQEFCNTFAVAVDGFEKQMDKSGDD